MTTIAVNREMMAGDSAVDAGGVRDSSAKVFNVDGHIIGFAGSLTEGLRFVKWYETHEGDTPALHESEVLILRKDGKIEYWDGALHPVTIKRPFTAIGCGSAAALGAMYAGADPTEAVKIACKVDTGTGGPVKTIKRTQHE